MQKAIDVLATLARCGFEGFVETTVDQHLVWVVVGQDAVLFAII